MSSLIEAAARRLEQLRLAGAVMPETVPAMPGPVPRHDARPSSLHNKRDVVAHDETASQGAPRLEVDLHSLTARGFITPAAKRSLAHDQFRVVKRHLIRNATGQSVVPIERGNLIMITSATAGEGKSFSAINLAMSIASELDHTVLLVDADVARPTVLRTLAPETATASAKGLLDLLEGQCELADVLLHTNVDKLTVLPSGAYRPHATELLASEAMRHLLDQVANRYRDRVVIFDSPPLLMTTEAQVLATQMGQVVLVVNAGKTPQRAVQSALATIETCPVKMLLLNRAQPAAGDSFSGYGYGYGYGYGEDTKGANAP